MSLIRKSKRLFICIFVLALPLCACKGTETDTASQPEGTPEAEEAASENMYLSLSIDGEAVDVAWEDNAAVKELMELASEEPYEISLSGYSDFEQVGPIGKSLSSNDEQMQTEPGDIVLYSGDQMVIFYGTNSWAYTRLGHIVNNSPEELKELLGKSGVTAVLSVLPADYNPIANGELTEDDWRKQEALDSLVEDAQRDEYMQEQLENQDPLFD